MHVQTNMGIGTDARLLCLGPSVVNLEAFQKYQCMMQRAKGGHMKPKQGTFFRKYAGGRCQPNLGPQWRSSLGRPGARKSPVLTLSALREGGGGLGQACVKGRHIYLPHVCPWDPPRRAATQASKCNPSPPAQEHNRPFAYHCGDVCAAPATQATGLRLFNSMMLSKVGLAICLSLSARRSARLGRVRCCRSSLVGSVIPHVLCSCRNLINRGQVSAEVGFSAKVYADRL